MCCQGGRVGWGGEKTPTVSQGKESVVNGSGLVNVKEVKWRDKFSQGKESEVNGLSLVNVKEVKWRDKVSQGKGNEVKQWSKLGQREWNKRRRLVKVKGVKSTEWVSYCKGIQSQEKSVKVKKKESKSR